MPDIEKYFQIARCMRDEDLRGDRQPEFTQLDLEMSFVERDDVLAVVEGLVTGLIPAVTPHKRIFSPFPKMSYTEAMARYGTDKPDLRFGMEIVDVTDAVQTIGIPAVSPKRLQSGGDSQMHHRARAAPPIPAKTWMFSPNLSAPRGQKVWPRWLGRRRD